MEKKKELELLDKKIRAKAIKAIKTARSFVLHAQQEGENGVIFSVLSSARS